MADQLREDLVKLLGFDRQDQNTGMIRHFGIGEGHMDALSAEGSHLLHVRIGKIDILR